MHRYGTTGSCAQNCLLSKLKTDQKQRHTHTPIHIYKHIRTHTRTRASFPFIYISLFLAHTRALTYGAHSLTENTNKKKRQTDGVPSFRTSLICFSVRFPVHFLFSLVYPLRPSLLLFVRVRPCVRPNPLLTGCRSCPHIPFLVSSLLLRLALLPHRRLHALPTNNTNKKQSLSLLPCKFATAFVWCGGAACAFS